MKAELGQLGVASSPERKGEESRWEAELQAELQDLELQVREDVLYIAGAAQVANPFVKVTILYILIQSLATGKDNN